MAGSKKENSVAGGQGSPFSETVSFFTSVRTTIGLLFVLAATSILGTVIPQEPDLSRIRGISSPFVFKLIAVLDLNDVFRSWWFLTLLTLLALNLLACMLKRMPGIVSDWRGSPEKASFRLDLSDTRSATELESVFASAIRPVLRCVPQTRRSDGAIVLSWVKHRVHLLGFPFIHTAIIVILAGGLIGVIYGFKGHALIKEGDAERNFTVIRSGEVRSLPFGIAVKKFTLTRYATGEPKEYRSDVILLESGKEVFRGPILVNQPLTFQGISLYQADYRPVGIKGIRLVLTGPDRKPEDFLLEPYTNSLLPGTEYRVRLLSVDPGATKRGAGAEIAAESAGREPRRVEVFEKDPAPLKLGDIEIRFKEVLPLYATGLQIGYDPGANLVWLGCSLLVVGFFLTLFTNHRRLTVELVQGHGQTLVRISGGSRRLRQDFRETVEAAIRAGLEEKDTRSP